jgi:hypothetical protein
MDQAVEPLARGSKVLSSNPSTTNKTKRWLFHLHQWGMGLNILLKAASSPQEAEQGARFKASLSYIVRCCLNKPKVGM